MKKILTTVCFAVLVAGSLPDPAEAARAQESTLRSTRSAVRDVREEVQRQGEAIIEALRKHAGEGSSYADKQIEAMKRFEDGAQQNAVQRQKDAIRAEAESGKFDPSPVSCLLAGLFGGGGGGGGGSAELGQGSAAARSVSGAMSGNDQAVLKGGTELAASVVQSVRPFQGRADGTVDPAIILENPTLDMSDAETAEVVERMMRNGINSTPEKPVTTEEMRTPEGVARAAKLQETSTRNNAALEVLAMVLNMKKPLVSSSTYQAYIDESAYNRAVPDMISELQGIDIRTVRFYAPNQKAVKDRQNMTDRALLMELVDLMSINTRIAYLSLEMQSRQAVVDAFTLAKLNDQN